ncbi:MAG: hypothetical protein ACSHX7_09835 [Luteolibacter sp.]
MTEEPMTPIAHPEAPRNDERKSGVSCFLVGLILLVVVALVAGGMWWWFNRPIKPVELSQNEKVVLEEKVESLDEPVYEKGAKEIVFTERELNGLLNQNTNMGEKLKFSLGTGEVHARLETDMDEDLPIVGGKKLKAKARFIIGDMDGRPSLILEDLTVWGASMPNDWLGGLKGKDLLKEIFGDVPALKGIEELRIENGQVVIRLAE